MGVPRRPNNASTLSGKQFAASVESYLCGRYENHLKGNNSTVPAWARLNCLAHGNLDALKQIAKRDQLVDPPSVAWDTELWTSARSTLAEVVVRIVEAGRASLAEVQDSVLIPLEAFLMGYDNVTAAQLAIVTWGALGTFDE